MQEIIAIREIHREIQTFVISGKNKLVKFLAHAKAFTLDTIPQSIVHEDNKCLPGLNTLNYHIISSEVKLKNWRLRLWMYLLMINWPINSQ